CMRYGFMEGLQSISLATTAEITIMLRIYAMTEKSKIFPCLTALVLSCQWALVALLIPRDLPTLPNIDPYHGEQSGCANIRVVVPFTKSFLSLSLAFDTLACMITIYVTVKSSRSHNTLVETIQRDGIMYFLVLFGSNLAWLLLLHYAPVWHCPFLLDLADETCE
ncbi:hypothetical protein K438DRAFT_1632417, partial [Mycena galopus ATCC 62051]